MSHVIDLQTGAERHTEDLQPNESLLQFVKEVLLPDIESGRVTGLAAAVLWHDHESSWSIVGRVGGYSHLGATTAMLRTLTRHVADD